jgi:hypothetical protein
MKKPGRLFPDTITPKLLEIERTLRAHPLHLEAKAASVRALRMERVKNLRARLRQSARR